MFNGLSAISTTESVGHVAGLAARTEPTNRSAHPYEESSRKKADDNTMLVNICNPQRIESTP